MGSPTNFEDEMPKHSLKSVALMVNHLLANGVAWRPLSNTDRVCPKTGVFIFFKISVLGKHKNIF